MSNPTYTVNSGDTLSAIAKKFGTSWQVLKALNGLADASKIFPGQMLKLPEGTATPAATQVPASAAAGARGPIRTQLPLSGTGFVTHNPDDPAGSNRYGTEAFVAALIAVGKAWADVSTTPVSFGDMSRKDGPEFPPHKGHKTGREVDIRPLRTDGKNLPVTHNSSLYDRAATRKFVKLFKQVQPGAKVFFNDPVLIGEGLTRQLPGHSDHLHIQIYS